MGTARGGTKWIQAGLIGVMLVGGTTRWVAAGDVNGVDTVPLNASSPAPSSGTGGAYGVPFDLNTGWLNADYVVHQEVEARTLTGQDAHLGTRGIEVVGRRTVLLRFDGAWWTAGVAEPAPDGPKSLGLYRARPQDCPRPPG